MRCLVVYDIPDDRVRTQVADHCLDYGLDRIQYSAFLGDLSRTHQEELMLKVKRTLGKRGGESPVICHLRERLGAAAGGHPGRNVGVTLVIAPPMVAHPGGLLEWNGPFSP
jgi:CRISPR-associated protein Cas2